MRRGLRGIFGAFVLVGCCAGQSSVGADAGRAQAGYDERFRPQVHFSPERNWTNDPNGLVFFEGEYHLFFQYNPFGDEWGHMSWGHAVSADLLHWRELPVAIPEAGDEMVFTGSVVVDERNTSGLCEGGKVCLVAIYTGHRTLPKKAGEKGDAVRQTQDLAVSQDRGRTWERYAGNPVLDLQMTDFRDPSVTWNAESHSWLMAVSLPNEHQVVFYRSPNLKKWTRLSAFGPAGTTAGQWECPNLLRVPAAHGAGSLWALKVGLNPGSLQGGSGEQYFLGQFDGERFTPSSEAGAQGWTDYGKDSYCAISYNHLRAGERPTLVGWMSNWDYAAKLPTAPWRGQMTLARRVTYLQDADGLALVQEPVIEGLRQGAGVVLAKTLTGSQETATLLETEAPVELDLHFSGGGEGSYGVRIYSDEKHWTEIGFDRARMKFYVDRTRSGADLGKGFLGRTEAPLAPHRLFDIRVILDRSSVEAFAQGGTIAMTNLIFPGTTGVSPQMRVDMFQGDGGKGLKVSGRSWKLGSIWKDAGAGRMIAGKRSGAE